MGSVNDLPLRALSIRQPWVWSILNAGKRIENRPRRFHYRGPICLHASLYSPTSNDLDDAIEMITRSRSEEWLRSSNFWKSHADRGGIVGTANIVDLVEESDDPWFVGPFGLVLDNVRPVDFIPVKGALGLFDWRKRL